jgi:hypothetical protein
MTERSLGWPIMVGQMMVGGLFLVTWLIAMVLGWPPWAVTLSFALGVVALLAAVWSAWTTLGGGHEGA